MSIKEFVHPFSEVREWWATVSITEKDEILNSFAQRRSIRDEIRHYTSLWQELCTCGGPQPGYKDDLKLDEHFADCQYVEIIEKELEEDAQRAITRRDKAQDFRVQ